MEGAMQQAAQWGRQFMGWDYIRASNETHLQERGWPRCPRDSKLTVATKAVDL